MERCWLVHFVCSRSPTEEYCWKPQKGPLIDDSQWFKARKLLNCTNSNSCLARCHTVFPLRPDLHPKLSKLASTLSFLPAQTRREVYFFFSAAALNVFSSHLLTSPSSLGALFTFCSPGCAFGCLFKLCLLQPG